MSKLKIRPNTQSVFDKLKQSTLANVSELEDTRTGSNLLTIPISQVQINAKNVRKTFTTLDELADFLTAISWPEDALEGGLVDPIQWIDDLRDVRNEDKIAFQRIVKRALSIKSLGQLQPAGAIKKSNHYDVVFGSTRAMACYLLNRDLAITLLNENDSLSSLKAHLSENLERDDLSFTETVTGYLRLFKMLVEANEIDRISRTTVMKVLSLSRTQALVWSRIINRALSDDDFNSMLRGGKFSGYREAIAYIEESTRSSEDLAPTPSPVTEYANDADLTEPTVEKCTIHTAETITDPETLLPATTPKVPIAQSPSPRILLSSSETHSDAMIQIVTAAFEQIGSQVNHPVSIFVMAYMEDRFPICDTAQAQRSIDWLTKIISDQSKP